MRDETACPTRIEEEFRIGLCQCDVRYSDMGTRLVRGCTAFGTQRPLFLGYRPIRIIRQRTLLSLYSFQPYGHFKRYGGIADTPDQRDHLYAAPAVNLTMLPPKDEILRGCSPLVNFGVTPAWLTRHTQEIPGISVTKNPPVMRQSTHPLHSAR